MKCISACYFILASAVIGFGAAKEHMHSEKKLRSVKNAASTASFATACPTGAFTAQSCAAAGCDFKPAASVGGGMAQATNLCVPKTPVSGGAVPWFQRPTSTGKL